MALIAPTQIDDITPAWLTTAMIENGNLESDNAVVDFERRIIGEGRGYGSRMAHYTLKVAYTSKLAPPSLVIKIEPASKEQVDNMIRMNTFEREIRFYQDVAPTAPLRLPKVYFTLAQPPCFAIAMEDLSDLTPGDQLIGMPVDQVERVIGLIAKLQAKYWHNDALAALEWMPEEYNIRDAFEESNWQSFREGLGQAISPEAIQTGELFRHHIDWIENEINHAPKTIVHYDLREDNMLFGEPETDEEIVVVDWAVCVRGCGAYDVARLMGGSETPSQRRGHQIEILKTWHDALVANGVDDYSFEEALYHFRICAMSFCSIPVYFHRYAEMGGRAPKLLEVIAQRAFESVLELEATSVLPK
ncbi:MAG: oxidoreductase family protein [Verrucomicrobiota bacterium]